MLILSLGENCLPGMLLKRFGVKNTCSTVNSSGKDITIYSYKEVLGESENIEK